MKTIPENSYCPKSRKEWREWLIENHEKQSSVWLIFYKKNTKYYNLSWSDAVEEALCFGWIDSLKKKIDEERYMQFITRRKPKSTWSKINKEKVEQLIEHGLMTNAGYRSIEIGKKNGSWKLLDEIDSLIIPRELNERFDFNNAAKEHYEQLSASVKKGILFWIVSAKRPETKLKRIKETVDKLNRNQLPKNLER